MHRYAARRRQSDLEELVRRHQPLARALARRFRGTSVASEDLEQTAYLGLIKALRRFDPDRGCAFSTFAVPTILGEVRRQCREATWPAHVPRPVQERVGAARRAGAHLTAKLARSPTVGELAARLGWDDEVVVESLLAARTQSRVSLDAPCDAEGDGLGVEASLGVEEPGYEMVECRAAIEDALPLLRDAERRVLRLRYADDRTFAQIGRELSIGPAQAARLLRRSLDHLADLAADGGRPAQPA